MKSHPVSDDQNDDSFPIANSPSKMGFSYCVMGIGVKYKLISRMAVCPDRSIGETTMFPEAYYHTLQNCPNLNFSRCFYTTNFFGTLLIIFEQILAQFQSGYSIAYDILIEVISVVFKKKPH